MKKITEDWIKRMNDCLNATREIYLIRNDIVSLKNVPNMLKKIIANKINTKFNEHKGFTENHLNDLNELKIYLTNIYNEYNVLI